MKWNLILTSLLVSAVLATTDEPETTTSRLHRSTFQEQLQWTTPLPTTESLPTELEATTDSRLVDTGTESAPAVMESRDSTEQQKPDIMYEESPEKVETKPDELPTAKLRHEGVHSSLQNEPDREEVFSAHSATDALFEQDKQNSSEASQTKPQQTLSVDSELAAEEQERDEDGAEVSPPPPIVSVEVEDARRDSPDSTTTSFPPKENPALDLKLAAATEPAAQQPITVDEGSKVLESASSSKIQTVQETSDPTESTTTDVSSDETSETERSLHEPSSEVSVRPIGGVTETSTTTDADRLHVSKEDSDQEEVSTENTDEKPKTSVGTPGNNHRGDSMSSSIFKSPLALLMKLIPSTETTSTTSSQESEQSPANFSEPTPLAEVTPEPQLNEVKSSLNASETDDSSSVEELPALSMMALKSPPLVEFSYKEGTPKPPSQPTIAIQKEPAKPIGEITEDDHVVENSHSTIDAGADSEPPQPEGVLEIARKVTKMLEDQYTAEESRLHRRFGNGSSPNVPIVIQRGTTPKPHPGETHSTPDYDYHSIELLRLRAREHNNHRDLETEATGRNQELHPRTSKIMNAGPAVAANKDKMIFIKTVPKGSLTTMEPPSTTVTSPSMVSSTSPATTTTTTNTTTTTVDPNLTEAGTNSTDSSSVNNIQLNKGTTPPKIPEDDYYDEPTEIVNEEDVVSSPEKPPQEIPSRQASIEPTKVIEDRPVMALVVQNPPNENSLTRKELKPLDTKDVQVSFILPAVSEPSLVPHEDNDATSSKEVTEELSTESIKGFTESPFDSKFPKPYPMQRVTTSTTSRPTSAPADDRFDSAPTANPMSTLAGGESSSEHGEFKLECPSREEIHPCTCVTHEDDYDGQIETVATCRGIKHSATLIEALRGFRGHHLTYLIIDNSSLPPFPNNILHRIQVDWMEVLNTPVQFKREYLQCSIKCTLS